MPHVRAVAIVNGTARRYRERLRARLERALPSGVRITRTLDEARDVLRTEIARGIDLVVFGGGDGTVVMGLTLLAEACRGAGKNEPAIGVLRLGSGNAIADTAGATDDPAADLARMAAGQGRWQRVPMLDVLGVRAPFVGVGVDAQLLEDHVATNRVVDRVPLARRLVGSSARYALSVALRSVPRFALTTRPVATVTNLGAPAVEMAVHGATGRAIPTDKVLWNGPCTLVAAATIPFFGFGLKMFSFAGSHPDRFQLRCGSAGLLEILRSTPAAFRGRYFSEQVRDFMCERVEIALEYPVAVEAGGELLGHHQRIEVGVAPALRLVHLTER